MSLIQRAADKAGIELDRDVPVPGQRRCRDWSKLIGLARKLESQDSEILDAERARSAALMEKNLQLQTQLNIMQEKLAKHTLKEEMQLRHIDKDDQKALLAAVAS